MLIINTLKIIEIPLYYIDAYYFDTIKVQNNSVNELIINWNNTNNDCLLYNLQKIFPNLINLKINTGFMNKNKINLEIKENPNSKVSSISLDGNGNKNIVFYCQSYDSLVNIKLNINAEIINLKKALPIFDDKCNISFNSLLHFSFINHRSQLDLNILENIYNKLDKIQNLKSFKLNCINKDITKSFYCKFLEKLSKMKLNQFEFKINPK